MAGSAAAQLEGILNGFAEVMSQILLNVHQQHLSELDLTLSQAQALRVLRRDGSVPTGHLAAELRISAPAVTQLTDRLLRKGLIDRQSAAGDRRTVLVSLSVKGRRLVDQFRKRRCEIFSNALGQLTEAERAQVIGSLEKLMAAFEQYESKLAIKSQPTASNIVRKQKDQQVG